jgi:rhodanese-related sulfurtransferase
MRTVTPTDVKLRLTPALGGSGPEIAFLDVREAGQYGEGHPFFAVNVPYSRLELEIVSLVPRKATPMVLLDDGDGVAEKAARRLAALGYGDVSILEGGAPGWAKAGFTLFKGVNLPSKAFGEIVEHVQHTPSLSAEELKAKVDKGEKLIILDGRSPQEYRRMTIPGARSIPNAELAHRLPALVADDTTTIVVNCAGRTRSIIGAQSLRNAGVKNPVIALRNGTQGWMLAGLTLENGSDPKDLPALDIVGLAQSQARAQALIARYKLPVIDRAELGRWQGDAARTTYLLDVRSRKEYLDGHLPNAVSAPGGQLVQATDQWVGTRGARLVLCDDTQLRAATTAIWLRGMGHDARILGEDVARASDRRPFASTASALGAAPTPLPPIAPVDAAYLVTQGVVFVDVNPGMSYRAAHIEGARWGHRSRPARLRLLPGTRVILVASEPRVAGLMALDLAEAGMTILGHLAGAAGDWEEAGLRITATPAVPADADCIDYLFFVHDRHDGNLDAARAYLSWETGLMAQMDAQETGVLRPLV